MVGLFFHAINLPARSNEYPLHLLESYFLGASVVKLRRARRGVVRHLRGAFKHAAGPIN